MVFENTSNDPPSLTNDTITPDHLLFLLPTNHPGLVLISKKLTGLDNYTSWRRSIMIALNAKNKMKIINKDFVELDITSLIRALWERNNDMIIYWILNTIVEKIRNTLNFINSVNKLWLELQKHYAQIDGHRIFQLTNDIAPYTCTCVCNCENVIENGKRDQRKRLVQFLMGLDESYSNIRGQILLMQPLPSVVKAYNMVKQEEKQREGLLPKPATSSTFSIHSNNQRPYHTNNNYQKNSYRPNYTQGESSTQGEMRGSFKKGVIYGNYGKEGHSREQCYKLIGYPVGHPMHGKFPPKPYKSQSQEYKPNKTVNMVLLMMQNNNHKNPLYGIFSSLSRGIPKFIASLISTLKDQNKRIAHGTICDGLYML
ncbi:cysteine-rich receptor-like protein kinase 8 [Tanacetum coccineum]